MQYFHPDNMSSAEKMKIELAKVREEFKMSESDCGSARVQGICSYKCWLLAIEDDITFPEAKLSQLIRGHCLCYFWEQNVTSTDLVISMAFSCSGATDH
jgi:hypothetical protein